MPTTKNKTAKPQEQKIYDIFIIGGGINGVGIARDAAGRGHSVYLAEMNDLASGTSSAATKLIHGGLRYLEHYEFSLVREALKEREILWAMAPFIIKPMRFILPYEKGLRPKWFLRLGLFIYDYIGGRKKLPPTKTINLKTDIAGKKLRHNFSTGFEYSDCFVDDARLVILNAKDAFNKGASINTRTKVISARQKNDIWEVKVKNILSGKTKTIKAKSLINAAGPWVDIITSKIENRDETKHIRLVKGSHIVVNKLFEHDKAYIFQNADNRIVFAIPYQEDFTLIGTTDVDYEGDPSDVSISSDELNYLCNLASHYFSQRVERSDVVWAYSGVRPLFDDGEIDAQNTTRDYVLKLENENNAPPLLNIFGGKLTTYRHLAQDALEKIETALNLKSEKWTANSSLPGGDFAIGTFDKLVLELKKQYPFMAHRQIKRMVRLYGTLTKDVLGDAKSRLDLGEDFGANLSAREVDYLIENEWAITLEDILWRRTKLGLFISKRDKNALEKYIANKSNF